MLLDTGVYTIMYDTTWSDGEPTVFHPLPFDGPLPTHAETEMRKAKRNDARAPQTTHSYSRSAWWVSMVCAEQRSTDGG